MMLRVSLQSSLNSSRRLFCGSEVGKRTMQRPDAQAIRWPGRQTVPGDLIYETCVVHLSSCPGSRTGNLSHSNLYNWRHTDNICLAERYGRCHAALSDVNSTSTSSVSFSW